MFCAGPAIAGGRAKSERSKKPEGQPGLCHPAVPCLPFLQGEAYGPLDPAPYAVGCPHHFAQSLMMMSGYSPSISPNRKGWMVLSERFWFRWA